MKSTLVPFFSSCCLLLCLLGLHLVLADIDSWKQDDSPGQAGGITPFPVNVPNNTNINNNFIDSLLDPLSIFGHKLMELISAPPKMILKVAGELWQHLEAIYEVILYQIKKYFF